MRSIFRFVLLLFLCTAGLSAEAASYAVAKTGNNSNPCTQSAPCLTITHGLTKLKGGDILEIGGGTYAESWDATVGGFKAPSGTANAYTTVRAKIGETVWIRPTAYTEGPYFTVLAIASNRQYIKLERINIDGSGLPRTEGLPESQQRNVSLLSTGDRTHHLIFDGMELKHSRGDAMHLRPASYGNIVRNMHIHDVGDSLPYDGSPAGGIYIRGPSCVNGGSFICDLGLNIPGNLIENNRFEDMPFGGPVSPRGDQINITLRNNIIKNTNGSASLFGNDVHNLQFYNNIIINGPIGPKGCIQIYDETVASVHHNTFYRTKHESAQHPCFGRTHDNPQPIPAAFAAGVHHNIFYDIRSNSNMNILPGDNFINQDPHFVDPANGNFCLKADSPAKGKGADCTTVGPNNSSGGSGNTGNTTGSTTGPCHTLSSITPVPQDYGAAYNVFSSARELLLTADCTASAVNITIGNDDPATYTYMKGYFWSGTAWTPVNYSCAGQVISDLWCAKKVTSTMNSSHEFFIGYVCRWNGTRWQCGCRDSTCATNYWQLQGVRR